jgi:hypothetical protein
MKKLIGLFLLVEWSNLHAQTEFRTGHRLRIVI